MIIGSQFEGDHNIQLLHIQHDVYGEMVSWLFHSAADRFRNDIHYTWVAPDFVYIIRKITTFDHRVLQDAHDLIAASYRYYFCPHKELEEIPTGFSPKAYYLASWKAYFFQEIGILAHDESISEAIVTAVAFENSERGYAAEDRLNELLLQRYKIPKKRE